MTNEQLEIVITAQDGSQTVLKRVSDNVHSVGVEAQRTGVASSQAASSQVASWQKVAPVLQVTSARTKEAGMQMANLSSAFAGGNMNAQNLASSLSGVAGATLSLQTRFPALAAQAFGVAGAIATVVGVMGALYAAYQKMTVALPEGRINDVQQRQIAGLKTIAEVTAKIAEAEAMVAKNRATLGRGDDDSDAAKAMAEWEAKRAALIARRITLENDAQAAGKKAADEQVRKAEETATKVLAIQDRLDNETANLRETHRLTEFERQKHDISERTWAEIAGIKKLEIAEDQREQLYRLAQARRKELITDLRIANEKAVDAEIKGELAKRKAADATHKQLIKSKVDYLVRSQESITKAALRMALEPIIGELEGLAISEGAKAIAAFPNLAKVALHTAGAAAAFAAARKVAQLGGGGGRSFGGGGGGGAAGSGGPTFEPRGAGAGGDLHLTIVARDPLGRETIQHTIYEMERSRILKRPVPVVGGITLLAG